MKISKLANAEARRIFRLCQSEGRLDEEKLMKAIGIVGESKPRDYRGIFAALQRLVRTEMDRHRVVIESAADLDDATREEITSGLTAKYGDQLTFEYRTTPELLGGLKIRVGNDVWDGSVKGRLDRLVEAF